MNSVLSKRPLRRVEQSFLSLQDHGADVVDAFALQGQHRTGPSKSRVLTLQVCVFLLFVLLVFFLGAPGHRQAPCSKIAAIAPAT